MREKCLFMADQIYHDILMDIYKNPFNKLVLPEFNEQLKVRNKFCGDEIELFINWSKGLIKEISWQGKGCAISEVSASLFTEFAKNKSKSEISGMKESDILKILGLKNLNPSRMKCAMLSWKAIKD